MISWRKHQFYTGRLYWNTGSLGYIKLSLNTKSDRKESATLTIYPCNLVNLTSPGLNNCAGPLGWVGCANLERKRKKEEKKGHYGVHFCYINLYQHEDFLNCPPPKFG